ncbi:MAG: hypothetical protein J3K34DRAFT_393961 [Monoraphidium minutum]|nr:MAG: hypothetical protein J3K34DRAFT_393961 [Monoraphidium minutum]
MQPGTALAGVRAPRRTASTAPPLALAPRRRARAVAAYATGGRGDEKSWGEIAADAAGVAKSVLGKVASGASAALKAISKPRGGPPGGHRPPPPPPQPPALLSPFGDGLLGRAAGGLLAAAAAGVARQMERQAAAARGVYEDAAAAVRSSPEVAAALGGAVSVGPAASQSSASSSVNGRVTKRVAMVLPVSGAGGRVAQAHVVSSEAPGAPASTEITVVLPSGESIRVPLGGGGGGGGGSGGGGGGRGGYQQQGGDVIDAEYTDVRP